MKTMVCFFLVLLPVFCASARGNELVQKVTADTSFDLVDLHVHLGSASGMTIPERYRKAASVSSSLGVVFGIAEEIEGFNLVSNNKRLTECLNEVRKYPMYLGLQPLMTAWKKKYSAELIGQLDYIMLDALVFPDNGRMVALWTKGLVFKDPQDFMERYIDYNLLVLADDIDIWCNPTYLPISLQSQYDQLWTEERMKKLIDAALEHNVAIEINTAGRIPSKKFILMAKAAGLKFTFGSNFHDVGNGDISWSVNMAKECGLTRKDFFKPTRKIPGS